MFKKTILRLPQLIGVSPTLKDNEQHLPARKCAHLAYKHACTIVRLFQSPSLSDQNTLQLALREAFVDRPIIDTGNGQSVTQVQLVAGEQFFEPTQSGYHRFGADA